MNSGEIKGGFLAHCTGWMCSGKRSTYRGVRRCGFSHECADRTKTETSFCTHRSYTVDLRCELSYVAWGCWTVRTWPCRRCRWKVVRRCVSSCGSVDSLVGWTSAYKHRSWTVSHRYVFACDVWGRWREGSRHYTRHSCTVAHRRGWSSGVSSGKQTWRNGVHIHRIYTAYE